MKKFLALALTAAMTMTMLTACGSSETADVATSEALADGVQLGTTGDFIAEELTSNVSQYNKAVDAVNDLVNGRVDLVIIDELKADGTFDELVKTYIEAE